MDKKIEAAVKWLCESDVINKDKQKVSFGGTNNGYIWNEKKYQYVYNEITGYSINAFISIYKWTGDKKYLQLSRDAADYLIRFQENDKTRFEYGGIAHSLRLPDLENVKKYYSFDNAIILHGILNLCKIAREEKYVNACMLISRWLMKMQKENGAFCSYYDSETQVTNHEYDEFFFDNGCLHVKNAIGLMYTKGVFDNEAYRQAGLKTCNWGEGLLANDNIFWANTRRKYVFTHAHCYAVEGYLYGFYLSKNEKYLGIAKKAGEALIVLQNEDGSLYRIYKNKLLMKWWINEKDAFYLKAWINERKHPWKTIDATSQAVRIWILLYSVYKDAKFLTAAEKAITFLERFQVMESNDKNMIGGMYYQLCDNYDKGKVVLSNGMYTWCTQFTLSAMILYDLLKRNVTFENLIEHLF
jgi:hypothetical protein